MSFENLGLSESLLRAVHGAGYATATPIQIQAIPIVLDGQDLMGCAQTGTGKTAAFALPTLQRLAAGGERQRRAGRNGRPTSHGPIRSLVLAPTRELAAQIAASFAAYGKFTGLRCTVVYGGVNQQPQVRALQAKVDILVATPGRLLDLMQQGYVDLKSVEVLVLDEADQMLDMGFLPDLRRIEAALPRRRQTLMFSATMPDTIRQLATHWLHQPQYVQATPVAAPAERAKQSVYLVETRNKPELLKHLLRATPNDRTLVFARTKHGADKIVKLLVHSGIHAAAIHGNKSQNARTRTLEQFKSQRPPVLVATDIAARGLDVKDISHVINYELPEVPELYIHRIGRTARAGATGVATSFCSMDERCRLQRIERLTRQTIQIETDQPAYTLESRRDSSAAVSAPKQPLPERRPSSPARRGRHTAVKSAASAGQWRGPKRQRRRVAKVRSLRAL